MKIGLLSDTHGHLDTAIFEYFESVDEVWHAGDVGDMASYQKLNAFKPLVAVYGNIDPSVLRQHLPEQVYFERQGLKIWMIHIGGYPPRYEPGIKNRLDEMQPDLFVCGHSHILKVMPDNERKPLLHINPGAAGHQGFHMYRTIVRLQITDGRIHDLEVIKLGKRGK